MSGHRQADQLQEEAAREELVLDRKMLGGTGFHPRRLPEALVTRLRHRFERIHRGQPASIDGRSWNALLCLASDAKVEVASLC
ncbi:hypothetical protein ACG873_25735 [Mesorhizobium sp. AaZ16]|uniref:hypothetical protein n=1 Tax=Mesorhizobium sp. AaZ16 TaxID=3402289 RepID=UPI00374FDA3E